MKYNIIKIISLVICPFIISSCNPVGIIGNILEDSKNVNNYNCLNEMFKNTDQILLCKKEKFEELKKDHSPEEAQRIADLSCGSKPVECTIKN